MPNSFRPFVSIIMPIKNEEKYIVGSLGSVMAQEYPSDLMEILVCDGISSDRTREIISNLASSSKFPITILDNPTGIVPKALNVGLNHAKGDIIIRIDGHCEIQKDYVQICVDHLQEQGVECVGGTIDTVGETFISKAIALAMSSSTGVGNVAFRVNRDGTELTDSVPFPAYPLRIFEEIGTFDEEMLCNEDDEFNYRLLKNGGRILLVSKLRTRYFSRGSLKSLWKQYFRYGLWKVRVMQKHPGQMRLRQFIPSLFVLAILALVTLTFLIYSGWMILAVFLAIYFLAILFSAARSIHMNELKYLPILLLVFPVLHLSYGSGFISGLFKFRQYF